MTITKRYLAPLFVAVTLLFAGAACGSDGDGGGSASGFCDTLKSFEDNEALNNAEFTDPDGMKKVGEAFRQLEASAPAEIKSDVKLIADAMSSLADIDPTDPEALEAMGESFDDEKLDAASSNVEDYAKDNCDIDLNE